MESLVAIVCGLTGGMKESRSPEKSGTVSECLGALRRRGHRARAKKARLSTDVGLWRRFGDGCQWLSRQGQGGEVEAGPKTGQ